MINFAQREKNFLFLLIDIILIILAVYLAFFLRFEGKIPSYYFEGALQGAIVLVLVFSLPLFYFFRLYAFSWAYVSTSELISLIKALAISFSFFGVTLLIFGDQLIFQGFPRSTLFISYFLIFIFSGGIRFSKRIYLQAFKKTSTEGKKRTLVVGIGDTAEQFLRTALGSKENPYLPIGLVDGNSARRGETIHGVRVLGGIGDISWIVEKNEIETIMISGASALPTEINDVITGGRKAGLKDIKFIDPSDKKIRDVRVEDLLQREVASLDTKLIGDFISKKSILITGAAGSIGSELSRQVAKFKPSLLLLLDQDETGIFNISGELKNEYSRLKIIPIISDVQDIEKIKNLFNKFKPNIIFHAAAYKHVPLMEENPDEAVKNNVFGMKVIAESALKFRAEKFIFISTDKAVKPISVMGASKRVGEMICQVLNKKNSTKFISVRFGNVLDSRGSVIPIFREQIEKRAPTIEVTHPEMERYFMLISEACLLVMQAGAIGKGGEVFVLDMGKPIKILDLAKKMIQSSGLEIGKDIQIIFTEPRPGEKIFEEILTAEEGIIATQNQKIFIAELIDIDEKKLNQELKKLKKATNGLNEEKIKSILKKAVRS